MISTILSKFAAPALLGATLGIGGVIGIQRATRQDIKLECPAPIVSLKCPDAVNTIDFDKVKGKNNIVLNQHYTVEMNGDSMIVKKIIDEMSVKLNELRLARCK